MTDETPVPTRSLSSEERSVVAELSEADLHAIDAAILASARVHWLKVAMVVAVTTNALEDWYPQLPDVFYAERICRLVELGRLESQGNLSFMRFSEVRLPVPRA